MSNWNSEDGYTIRYVLEVLAKRFKRAWLRFVVCRGNKTLFLRALGARIGQGCSIMNKVADFEPEPWLIEVGDHTTLAYGVRFLTHDGSSRVFRRQMPDASVLFGNRFGTIKIGTNCFIGYNAVILFDVEIGSNSIVGAGSVVTQSVPPDTVVAGIPAKVICNLGQYIEKYRARMIPIEARNRQELRRELTQRLWGESR